MQIDFFLLKVVLGLVCPPFVMKLNFKSLKEYKLLLMTEDEFRAVEDEEQIQEQEREQNSKNKTRERNNLEKR